MLAVKEKVIVAFTWCRAKCGATTFANTVIPRYFSLATLFDFQVMGNNTQLSSFISKRGVCNKVKIFFLKAACDFIIKWCKFRGFTLFMGPTRSKVVLKYF